MGECEREGGKGGGVSVGVAIASVSECKGRG